MAGNFYGTDKSNVLATNIKGGLGAKGLADAFNILSEIGADDEKKKQEAKLLNNQVENSQLKLDDAYGNIEQKAIDDTYMQYVNPKTGAFNQEALDKDNVGLPVNQVSQETKQNQMTLQNAFSKQIADNDVIAQGEINSELQKEALKYKNLEDFNKGVNADLLRYGDGKTLANIDGMFNKKNTELKDIKDAKADLAQSTTISQLKIKLEKEKGSGTTKTKIKAADNNSILKSAVIMYGGIYDPVTGKITGLDKEKQQKMIHLASVGGDKFINNKGITHTKAVEMAFEEINNPTVNIKERDKEDNLTLFLTKSR